MAPKAVEATYPIYNQELKLYYELWVTTSLAPIKAKEDSFTITFAPLSLEEVYALADTPSNGAVVVMSGTVRNQTDGKPVVALGIKLTNRWHFRCSVALIAPTGLM